jgi:hypothetical protein
MGCRSAGRKLWRKPREKTAGVEPLESRLLLSATWTVTSTADDGNVGTLRYAIDHSAPGDTIQFDPAILNSSKTPIKLNGTQLEISHDLSIAGPGYNFLSLQGYASRVLVIAPGATVSISGLELTNGTAGTQFGGDVYVSSGATLNLTSAAVTSGGAARGGGIYNAGTLNLSDSAVSINGNSPNLGGGIYNDGTLSVSGSSFGSNQGLSGGAIYNAGSMALATSSFSYNWTLSTLQASSGGAIRNAPAASAQISDCLFVFNHAIYGAAVANSGAMSVTRSTFDYNNAYHDYNLYGPHPAGGGAIYTDGTLDLTNAILYHNWTPEGPGGGVYVTAAGVLTVANATISANNGPGGGGIYAEAGASVSLNNTIVSGNSYSTNGDNSQTPSDITGAAAGSFDLIGAGGSGGLANGVDGNIVGPVDPGLVVLFDQNAAKISLRSGSPAFNAGCAALARDANGQPLTTDQRGRPRVVGGQVDIGAYEAQFPTATTALTATAGPDEVQLLWAINPDAATYNVYRTTDPDSPPGSPIATNITVHGYLDTAVTAGVTYYYTVTAVNALAEGPPSSPSVATPYLPVIEGTPGDDTIHLTSPGDQHVHWTMGSQSGSVRIDDPIGLTINGNGGSDTITVFVGNDPQFPNVTHFNGTFTITGRVPYPLQAGQTWDLNRSTIYFPDFTASDIGTLIRDQIRAGYNGGAWDGVATPDTNGLITSTAARNDPTRTGAIGYVDYADGTGINTVPNTIELKYTVAGDANLDGVVNASDALALARNYLVTGNGAWDQGNFNYDTAVDLADAKILQANFGMTLTAAAVGSASNIITPPSAPATPVSTGPGSPSKDDQRHGHSDNSHPHQQKPIEVRDAKRKR